MQVLGNLRVGLGLWSQTINITKRVPPFLCSPAVLATPAVQFSGGRSHARLGGECVTQPYCSVKETLEIET